MVAAVTVLVGSLPAAASAGQTGYDVSYPQCNGSSMGSAPSTIGSFDIIGVNGGIVYSANPCLAAEYQWAAGGGAVVSFYVNTANPGPQSAHWPGGQQTPEVCPVQKHYRIGTSAFDACSYDYGWDAAANSLAGAEAVTPTGVARGAQWWLDVESANSWTHSTTANIDDIHGALAYLQQHTAQAYVGLYTNSSSWSSITGSSSVFDVDPFWAPGATANTAAATCADPSASVTGGHMRFVQYQVGNFDNDYDCG